MATMSIKALKERAMGLWRLSKPKPCCNRPRVDLSYDVARDEVFGACVECDREVFRYTSAQIVAQSPESARSEKERSRVRRSQPVVRNDQVKLGVPADGIDGPQTQRAREKRARQLAEQVQAGVLSVEEARTLLLEESAPKKPDKPDTKTTAIDTSRFANLEDD